MTRRPALLARAALFSVAVGAVLALAGCSGSSNPVQNYRGEPHGVEAPASSAGGASFAVWLEKGSEFAVTMYGSSVCPPVASGFTVAGANKLKLALKPLPTGPCTMDYTPHTTVFSTPSAIRKVTDVTILIPGTNGGGQTTIVLPGFTG